MSHETLETAGNLHGSIEAGHRRTVLQNLIRDLDRKDNPLRPFFSQIKSGVRSHVLVDRRPIITNVAEKEERQYGQYKTLTRADVGYMMITPEGFFTINFPQNDITGTKDMLTNLDALQLRPSESNMYYLLKDFHNEITTARKIDKSAPNLRVEYTTATIGQVPNVLKLRYNRTRVQKIIHFRNQTKLAHMVIRYQGESYANIVPLNDPEDQAFVVSRFEELFAHLEEQQQSDIGAVQLASGLMGVKNKTDKS